MQVAGASADGQSGAPRRVLVPGGLDVRITPVRETIGEHS